MALTPKTIWVTGAGRSGTNLVGMMVDGHPDVNVFPYELRIIAHWLEASSWASREGGQVLPGSLLDEMLIKPHLNKARFEKLGIRASDFSSTKRLDYSFFGYIERLNKVIFPEPAKTFLYRAPGSQVDFFLKKAQDEHREHVHVLLILRHPVQNYLSLLSHDLQKGLGYLNETIVQPRLGLHTIMHANLLRVLNAFQAAKRWASDKRVTITTLEKITADSEERKRIWAELGFALRDTLQELTRVGERSFSSSGKWRTTEIQPVESNVYTLRLSQPERLAFEKTRHLFEPYYDDSLAKVDFVEDERLGELLMQREVDSLKNNQNALDKRNERIRSVSALPRSLHGWSSWPSRVVSTLRDDVMFYPQARIRRMNAGHKDLSKGLAEIPELFGMVPQ